MNIGCSRPLRGVGQHGPVDPTPPRACLGIPLKDMRADPARRCGALPQFFSSQAPPRFPWGPSCSRSRLKKLAETNKKSAAVIEPPNFFVILYSAIIVYETYTSGKELPATYSRRKGGNLDFNLLHSFCDFCAFFCLFFLFVFFLFF